MRAVLIVAVAALTGAASTACGQGGPAGPPSFESPPSATGGTVTASPAQPSPTDEPGRVAPPNEKTPGPGHPAGPKVLTGTVTAGVEPGCLLLDGYLLVGGPRDVLRPGARVVVTGQEESNLMSTCMQGKPFRVHRAQPA